MKAGWKTVNLGDILKVQNGYAFDSKFFGTGGMPLIRIRDIKHGTTTETSYSGDYDEAYVVHSGDYLIGMDGEFRCYMWRGPAALLNQRVCRLTNFSPNALPAFICYGINKYLKEIEDVTGYSTVKHLSSKSILSIQFPLPPLAEQKRIVALLDEAFAGIDTLSSNANTRSSEALRVFEQERDSFFANSDNKHSETTISEITTRLQYGTSEKSAPTGRYAVLRMGNIQDGEIDYEDLKYTSSQEVIDQYSLKPGDVLFNRTNSPQWVGKSAIYRGEMPAVFAGYNIRIHTITDKVDSEFLTFFLNSNRAISFGRSTFISSVNQANINAEKLRSYRLPLPQLREQKVIADRLGQIRKMSRELAAIHQKSLAQSRNLKAAILTSAFNGTL